MRLVELEPEFIRYEIRTESRDFVVGDPATWRERGCPTETRTAQVHYRIPVATLAEAQGIHFLCPACFLKNQGSVGTHWCEISFANRNVPAEEGSHNQEGQPVRWAVSGSSMVDLTTTPSIQLQGGCNWHGFITHGEIQ